MKAWEIHYYFGQSGHRSWTVVTMPKVTTGGIATFKTDKGNEVILSGSFSIEETEAYTSIKDYISES
jgi:hypothetical protein